MKPLLYLLSINFAFVIRQCRFLTKYWYYYQYQLFYWYYKFENSDRGWTILKIVLNSATRQTGKHRINNISYSFLTCYLLWSKLESISISGLFSVWQTTRHYFLIQNDNKNPHCCPIRLIQGNLRRP